jgi:ubiquinone/menaquinone biosynthesis C-methylase UbiE
LDERSTIKMESFRNRIANIASGCIKNVKGGYFGRARFLLTYFIYHFLPYFGYDYQKLPEWKFILKRIVRNKDLKILDVGCCASLFIYELARFGRAYGVDSRPYFERLPKSITFLQSDCTKLPFDDNYFDYITVISVIEHIGFGAYDDPLHNDGDFKALDELTRVLKQGGRIFLTTDIGTGNPDLSLKRRIYDEKRIISLFEKLKVVDSQYFIFRARWVPVNKDTAFSEPYDRSGLACFELRK